MKTGRTLVELATELQRQAESKKDYVADSRRLRMELDDSDIPERKVYIAGVNGGMRMTSLAHQQLANTLGIPKAYYDRMLAETPDLLASNVNRWFDKQPAKKLIRTLDGKIRAILSDSYRPLDNFDLAQAVLPKLMAIGAEVKSGEVTENRFYLKAITDKIQGEPKRGDVIYAGVVVSNSEVGQGSLRVEAIDYRLVCTNGMISEQAVRKAHLGRGQRSDLIEDAREYFSDATRQKDDEAFFAKVQDATAAMFSQERFNRRIAKYTEASEKPITGDAVGVVEVTAKRFGLNEQERGGVLEHLIRGGDMSAWGLANAITRTAQDVDSYDRATELESLGGVVVELPQSQWRVLATGKARDEVTA